jgi:RHS repeat-associated protein
MVTTGCETGKERDAETGLDYFGARYLSSAQGRFTSADTPLIDQNPTDPQSWNLYAYARNNPLKYVDPSGRAIELTGDDEERKKQLKALQEAVGRLAPTCIRTPRIRTAI